MGWVSVLVGQEGGRGWLISPEIQEGPSGSSQNEPSRDVVQNLSASLILCQLQAWKGNGLESGRTLQEKVSSLY